MHALKSALHAARFNVVFYCHFTNNHNTIKKMKIPGTDKEMNKRKEPKPPGIRKTPGKEVVETETAVRITPGVTSDASFVSQSLADLRMDLTGDFFRKIEAAGKISISNDPAENLRKIGLLKDDQVTFAALLLFGEHHTGIHVVRYKTKDEILEELMIRSPLMQIGRASCRERVLRLV